MDDSANEHKNGRACHSLIRSNSRTSADAAKKKKKKNEMQIPSGVESSPRLLSQLPRRITLNIASICEYHLAPRRDIFRRAFLMQSDFSIEPRRPSSGKLLMNVERDARVIRDDKRIMKDKAEFLALKQSESSLLSFAGEGT